MKNYTVKCIWQLIFFQFPYLSRNSISLNWKWNADFHFRKSQIYFSKDKHFKKHFLIITISTILRTNIFIFVWNIPFLILNSFRDNFIITECLFFNNKASISLKHIFYLYNSTKKYTLQRWSFFFKRKNTSFQEFIALRLLLELKGRDFLFIPSPFFLLPLHAAANLIGLLWTLSKFYAIFLSLRLFPPLSSFPSLSQWFCPLGIFYKEKELRALTYFRSLFSAISPRVLSFSILLLYVYFFNSCYFHLPIFNPFSLCESTHSLHFESYIFHYIPP